MNASSEDQLRLLDVQVLDTTLDQLAHRKATLPELAELKTLTGRRDELADEIVRAQTEDSDLGREQAKVDVDVETVRSRMTRDQQRLDSGQVSSPKELENLQHEIESLHRRQTELEDAELEVMEQREAVQTRVSLLKDEQGTVVESMTAAEQRRDAAYEEIAAQSEKSAAQRAETATTIDAELVTLYEKLRSSSAGIGAAALHRGRCEGCHLQLNNSDLNRLRDLPEDEVARCEECRRILIRTAESGL